MSRVHGDAWESVPRSSLRVPAPRGELDVAARISVVVINHRTVFASELGQREMSWVRELRSVRTQWAHHEPFAPEDVHRALDTFIVGAEQWRAGAVVLSAHRLRPVTEQSGHPWSGEASKHQAHRVGNLLRKRLSR